MFDLIVAYRISDMLFSVRVEEASRKSSGRFERTDLLSDIESIPAETRVLIVCDLTAVKGDLANVRNLSKEKNWRILGYYPHIEKETGDYARSLGVDYVVPRSAFQTKLVSLLS